MTDYTNISTRAMLATLSISVWSAQRFDKRASEEVTDRARADRSSGRFNKHLFGTRRAGRAIAPEFFAVLDAGEQLSVIHCRETLPWSRKGGERLLPVANYFPYLEAMRRAGDAFARAIDVFIDAYPRLQQESQQRLGSLYDDDDFIPADLVRGHFGHDVAFMPIARGAGDLRIDLPADHVAAIERAVTEKLEARTKDAMQDAWTRLREAVERIQNASGEGGVVRDTLIDHARDVVDILGRLNVSKSEELEEMRRQVERELTGIAVEDLRTDKKLRQDTERRAAAIVAKMNDFFAPAVKEVA